MFTCKPVRTQKTKFRSSSPSGIFNTSAESRTYDTKKRVAAETRMYADKRDQLTGKLKSEFFPTRHITEPSSHLHMCWPYLNVSPAL